MRVRTAAVILTLALGLLAVPLPVEAQKAERVYRIGFLGSGSHSASPHLIEAFLKGLHALGWVEGQNFVLETRWAEGRYDRLPDLAAELVRLGVAVIVAGGEPAIRAAQHATSTIPIVMAVTADPVGSGFVASLARPGGNITGLSILATEVGGKRLELLKEVVPQALHVAVLWNAAYQAKTLEWHDTQVAARALGVTLQSVEVRGPTDFDRAFAAITQTRPDALITFSDPLTLAHQKRIVDFTATSRLPMISEIRAFAEVGGLMTYGASLPGLFRRSAYYVDRILKGTNPADLPVERPTKFDLTINLKTARALGLTIPPSLLFQADSVIK